MRSVRLLKYQIRVLTEELDELESATTRSRSYPLWLKELYWTVTRLLGLDQLRMGARRRRLGTTAMSAIDSSAQKCLEHCLRPRVLIDATHTIQTGRKNGVQRVVRNLAFHSVQMEKAIPFVIENDLPLPFINGELSSIPLQVEQGDILVLADVTPLSKFTTLLEEIREKGGKVVFLLYDLIPLSFPGTCRASYVESFAHRLDTILAKCDSVVTISKSVAGELEQYLRHSAHSVREGLRIGWFHLGYDLDEVNGEPSPDVKAIPPPGPFFLTVGTLEPRKGHLVALDAFERLWARGSQARYVIAGRYGWSARALVSRIRNHPEFGRRLLWVEGPEDASLQFLYRNAAALVYPSIAEGFGLPLIEAARYGTRIIASDLPVFREICGDHALYFEVLDDAALAERIEECLAGRAPTPDFSALTWKQATEQFLLLLRDDQAMKGRWRLLAGAKEGHSVPFLAKAF